jgi:hypothetical protein
MNSAFQQTWDDIKRAADILSDTQQTENDELDRLNTAHRWLMLECDQWRQKAERLEDEIVGLRELVQRARDMINVSPDSPPWTWPTTDQIDQFVKDCDAVLLGEKNRDQ